MWYTKDDEEVTHDQIQFQMEMEEGGKCMLNSSRGTLQGWVTNLGWYNFVL